MLPIALLSHGRLVKDELTAALRRVPDVRLVTLVVPVLTCEREAERICAEIGRHECRVAFTLNDWGLDSTGTIHEFLLRKGILHVNWHVDDPFFMEIVHGCSFLPAPNRLDFVSDRGYVEPLRTRGFRARFLPLATDPSLFHPVAEQPTYERDVCFVGNSYKAQTEELLSGLGDLPQRMLPGLGALLRRYREDPCFDVASMLEEQLARERIKDGALLRRTAYALRQFMGFLYRKEIVSRFCEWYPDFKIFGDEFWAADLPAARVSTAVGYYTNLCETYCRTRVNIDINRTVIRDGFTQRIFDCPASGGFLITSPKPIVGEYFETRGPGAELCVFDNEEHLRDRVDYYLAHEQERLAIANRGRRKVLAHHTYDHRIAEIFGRLKEDIGEV